MASLKDWNHRFVQFCRSQEIQDPTAFDSSEGKILDFVAWNTAKLKEFEIASPESFLQGRFGKLLSDFAAYDAWLAKQYGEIE
jgi:hypothetical protein